MTATEKTIAVADPVTGPTGGRRSGGVLRLLPAVVVLVLLALVPFVVDPFGTSTLSRVLVFALFACSLDLLVGITGLPSLGHAAYFGVGAYTAGLVSIHVTAEAPVPVLAGMVAGGLAAATTGWLAVRNNGVFFLMLTLAIGELVFQLAQSASSVTGGSNGLFGIPAVRIAGEPLTLPGYVYWYVLAVAALGFAGLWTISRSPVGAVLRGIRDNEPRMRSVGYSPFRYKLAAFVLAGAFAGLAGGLFAAQVRLVTPSEVGFELGALALLAVILGGAGSLWGPVLGAAVVVLVRDGLGPSLDGHGPLVLGIVFVLAVYLLPRGFAGLAGFGRLTARTARR
ncbi:MAG: Amino acid/amide transporter rane component, family [Klenkia sp.]|nr:Amino acid/amide transporter rane component, family [Klenkia sp.]